MLEQAQLQLDSLDLGPLESIDTGKKLWIETMALKAELTERLTSTRQALDELGD